MGRKDWGRGGESEGMDKVEKVRVRKRWERERVGEREGGKERVWREEDRKRREEIERVGKGEKGKEKVGGKGGRRGREKEMYGYGEKGVGKRWRK